MSNISEAPFEINNTGSGIAFFSEDHSLGLIITTSILTKDYTKLQGKGSSVVFAPLYILQNLFLEHLDLWIMKALYLQLQFY